ncbi:MAG: di-heme-cytochrome C peroxidase [Hellea sp.]
MWTTSWFDWVQYDGSIMQPLIRNSGEALGVKAVLNTSAPEDQRFASSINMNNLTAIEKWIGGTNPVQNGNKFNGLSAPKWPAALPDINSNLAKQGEALYNTNCSGCHLPSVTSEEFWSDKYWKPIEHYSAEGELQTTEESYLNLKIIPVDFIGTDPRQSKVLTERRVDTTGLGLNTQVCTVVEFESGGVKRKGLKYVDLKDSPNAFFGFSLGAIVDQTNERWFEQNYTSPETQFLMKGDGRPNCLLPGQGYKARPLNGVWATAPFLHNGSVATIYDLLTPASDRPKFVELGTTQFDPKKLGVVQSQWVSKFKPKTSPKLTKDYSPKGYFILDSRQEGNWNTGHSFENDRSKEGVIGRAFSEEEKWALIEYLKTQ